MTLAVTSDFVTLFVVIIFHRKFLFFLLKKIILKIYAQYDFVYNVETFEGLGIGSRLADLEMPRKYNWVPIAGALLYGLTTPVGIAIGLGVRTSYNPGSATASIVSGILDSLSAGGLVYTGLVEVSLLYFALLRAVSSF